MSLLSLHHQDAAQALFELRSAKPSLAAPLPAGAPPLLPATPTATLPLFILPNLSAFSVMAASQQHHHHQQQPQQLPLLSTYLATGGKNPFFPSLLPLSPSPWPMTTMMSASSPAPTSENNSNNNQRLSVSYLLNNDDSTATAIKQEPDVYTAPSSPASSSSSSPSSSPKRKATSRPPTSLPKEKRLKAEATSSVSTTAPPSSSSSSSSSQLPQATAVASAFKGDLSLFPHLQLQLQREQLDPQQHTELVLKVWNRQQQVLKLQQLQHKKQELKAQRLQQRSQRKNGGAAANNNKATASPASPLTPPSSSFSPSSPSPSSSSPSSPTTGPAADVVSALPTLDDILNGADVIVDEASDEEAAAKGQKKPRRRISARQVAVLEQVFAVEPFPGPSTKKVIAKKLGMKERSITIWFQNKRARLKRIDNEHKEHHESESGGKREVTFHNLAVGFDGKLDMLPEDH